MKMPQLRGVLFDMDGTLTRPLLDFGRIKEEMGIGEQPILEALAEMQPAERALAEQVLCRHEETAAAESTLNEGCEALLDQVAANGLKTALITRNSRRSVETVIGKHCLKLDRLYAREDGPAKPDPHLLQLACRDLGVGPGEVWMVGDGEYDVGAAIAAGIRSVWVSHGEARWFTATPWRVVRDLIELGKLIERGGE